MAELTGNLLILQTGPPTAVGNCALSGIIEEALRHDHVEEIYGALNGARGLLAGNLIDLGQEKRKTIEGLRRTPGSALGSSDVALSSSEAEPTLAVLKTNEVRLVVVIGGSEAVAVMRALESAARAAGYELSGVVVLQSALNETAETDHALGYGSAARFVAAVTRDAALEANARRSECPVVLVEVPAGRTGWLAAAAALGRQDSADACVRRGPDLICFPERVTEIDQVTGEVQRQVQEKGSCVVVLADSRALRDRLGAGCAVIAPGPLARVSHLALSRVDADEAVMVGQTAARTVLSNSGYAIILRRDAGANYKCTAGTTQLEAYSTEPRTLPDEFISQDGRNVTEAFLDYARPLIGGPLTEFVALDNLAVGD